MTRRPRTTPCPRPTPPVTEFHHALEEAAENGQPEPGAHAGEAGVVRQRLVQVVAQVPPVREVERGGLHELRSERRLSKNRMSCSLKNTTGSMDGRPMAA